MILAKVKNGIPVRTGKILCLLFPLLQRNLPKVNYVTKMERVIKSCDKMCRASLPSFSLLYDRYIRRVQLLGLCWTKVLFFATYRCIPLLLSCWTVFWIPLWPNVRMVVVFGNSYNKYYRSLDGMWNITQYYTHFLKGLPTTML